MADPVVELSELSVRLGGRWVLVRLSLAVPRGATVLLTGDNGAGKTTLLRVIATALRPTRGTVKLFGEPLHGRLEQHRARLAFVGHQSHFYESMTAREALSLVAELVGKSKERIPEHLGEVRLDKDADRPIAGFSAGMKRRLCLARLLLVEPELALLDEPFTALDPAGVELASAIITRLHQAGVTTIVASHDHERTRPLCSHSLVLSAGEVASAVTELRS